MICAVLSFSLNVDKMSHQNVGLRLKLAMSSNSCGWFGVAYTTVGGVSWWKMKEPFAKLKMPLKGRCGSGCNAGITTT